jgi:hypothetical protein
VGLKRGPLCLMSTSEELLGRNSSGFGLENREYGRGIRCADQRDTLYPQNLALTSPPCGGRSVGIVRLRTKTTEFVLFLNNSVAPLIVLKYDGEFRELKMLYFYPNLDVFCLRAVIAKAMS